MDFVANRTLSAGAELQSDHPGFNDPVYTARRQELGKLAKNYKAGQPIPRIEYTEVEHATWGAVWRNMRGLTKK